MDSFTSNAFNTSDTYKNYDSHDTAQSKTIDFKKPSDTIEIHRIAEPATKTNDPKEEAPKKARRAYNKKKTLDGKQETNQAEMKLFSVYVANGWNRVDGTAIAETEESVKNKAFKMLKIDDDEKDNTTVIINEITTGMHLVK